MPKKQKTEAEKAYAKAWYQKNREKLLADAKAKYDANPEHYRAKTAARYKKEPDKLRAEVKAHARRNRLAALEAYGGAICACCKEIEERFLTIDHIHGCTKAERKEQGLGSSLYQWLKTNGYPSGFQVLCFNCNLGRAKNGGVCPHQDPHRLTTGRVVPFNIDHIEFGSLDADCDAELL